MPTVSMFFGIIITMYWREHGVPHFHARYGDMKIVVNIETLEVIEGKMSRRALGLVMDWAELHKAELIENWNRAREKGEIKPIKPLE